MGEYTGTFITLVVIALFIIASKYLSGKFTEKYGRRFIFNQGSLVILLSYFLMLVGWYMTSDYSWPGLGHMITFTMPEMVLTNTGELVAVSEFEDTFENAAGIFTFGLLIFISTWIFNMFKSNPIWGTVQMIFQIVYTVIFSIFLLGILFLSEDKRDKRKKSRFKKVSGYFK